ncbi:MAG: non-ribosomal peptide synthetase, partial [bacterium]|nr:non-ribosomal peptide synthetase [bacterium]
FYKERNIRVSDGTPMHLNILLNYPLELGHNFPVKTFLIGGDVLELDTGQKFLSLMTDPSVEIINVYGPTECCDVSTSYTSTCQSIQGLQRIPIGKPLNNVKCYILGRSGELLPIGIPGELHIAGDGLGRGYLNNPEMTMEKFEVQSLHFALYHTGDLARWLPDGNLEFLGRIDHQVKIRGYRIELEEIQARLQSHENVKESVVIARDDGAGNKYLCAYLVPVQEDIIPVTGKVVLVGEKVNSVADELKTWLSVSLPDYMIPPGFTFLEELPLTPNGKIDLRALPVPALESRQEYQPPRNQMEERLLEIWRDVLDRERGDIVTSPTPIGIDDNFFEIGGQSLKATVMISKIHRELNIKVPLAQVFKDPTIKGLSRYIE